MTRLKYGFSSLYPIIENQQKYLNLIRVKLDIPVCSFQFEEEKDSVRTLLLPFTFTDLDVEVGPVKNMQVQ